MSDAIRVNGNLMSWGSIAFKVQGDRFHGFTSITYADKRERTLAHGMGRHQAPRGMSRGKYAPEPSTCKGFKSSVQALREKLAAGSSSGRAYGDTVFDVLIQYIEPGETPITVELERCRWTGNSSSEEESGDALTEEFTFQPMIIRRNGLVLFDDSEGQP